MKKTTKFSILLVSILGLAGCVGQPDINKITQNGGNFKDVLQKDKGFTIVADNKKETLVSAVNYAIDTGVDGESVYDMYDLAKAYCDNIGGKSIVGTDLQNIQRLYPNPMHFSTAKIVFATKTAPNVLFKCVSNKDGFSIIEKGLYQAVYGKNMLKGNRTELAYYYRYFLIKHDKPQKYPYKDKDLSLSKNYSLPTTTIKYTYGWNNPPMRSYEYVSYYANLICRNNDGKSYIQVRDKLFDFDNYLTYTIKRDYKKSGWRDIQYLHIAPMSAKFYCKLPNNKGFEAVWNLKGATIYPYIKDKVDFNKISTLPLKQTNQKTQNIIQPISQQNTTQMQQINSQLSNMSIQKGIGYKVLATQKPFLLNTGMVTYQGYYIGKYQGCDRSAVIVKTSKEKTIYNYAKCGNEYKDLGITPPVAFDRMDLQNIKALLPTLKTNCKINGSFKMKYRNNDFICRYKDGTYQIFIMQNGYLAGVEEER